MGTKTLAVRIVHQLEQLDVFVRHRATRRGSRGQPAGP